MPGDGEPGGVRFDTGGKAQGQQPGPQPDPPFLDHLGGRQHLDRKRSELDTGRERDLEHRDVLRGVAVPQGAIVALDGERVVTPLVAAIRLLDPQQQPDLRFGAGLEEVSRRHQQALAGGGVDPRFRDHKERGGG